MTRRLLARWLLAGALAAWPLAATPAWAQDLSHAAFYGNWKGSALSESELSVYFRLTERDLDVTIGPAGAGFTVAWSDSRLFGIALRPRPRPAGLAARARARADPQVRCRERKKSRAVPINAEPL